MKKVIVTTSINPPTEAIQKFDSMPDWTLIVIGDLTTPKDYKLKNGTYFGPEQQEKYDKELSDAIGWNCIQRRNFGFLIAHDMGAEIVATVDDDNIPLPGWGQDLLIGREVEVNFYETELVAFDPVGATTYSALWHRGYPLQLISQRNYEHKTSKTIIPDIQADFWNGDPDIDAICRMEHAPTCDFDPASFPIASNKMAPFNSQNTFFTSKILPDYFLMPFIGRMDDIWASYYVQAKDYKVAFAKASVYQQRNPHDPIADMRKEYIGYENNLKLIQDLARDPHLIKGYLPERALQAWELYNKHFK